MVRSRGTTFIPPNLRPARTACPAANLFRDHTTPPFTLGRLPMERFEKIRYLNEILLGEMPEYRAQAAQFSQEEAAQRRLLRSLMNLRPPRGRSMTSCWSWNWAWGPIRRPLSSIPFGNTPARIPRRSMPASIWERRWPGGNRRAVHLPRCRPRQCTCAAGITPVRHSRASACSPGG